MITKASGHSYPHCIKKLLPYWQPANNISQAINSPLLFALCLWKFITEIKLNCGHENAHILTSNTANCSAAAQGYKSGPAWTCLSRNVFRAIYH